MLTESGIQLARARVATSSDLRFIHSSWHTSYWHLWAKKYITREIYGPEMDLAIESILGRHSTRAVVAFLPEVEDEVLGYSVINAESLHWVYVKGPYRNMGIGKSLVPSSCRFFTHATDSHNRKFLQSLQLVFNPFRAR